MSHRMPEPRIFKHQKLMNEFNDMMIRIKRHLYDMPTDEVPTREELDSLTNRIISALKENSEPMIKHTEGHWHNMADPDYPKI